MKISSACLFVLALALSACVPLTPTPAPVAPTAAAVAPAAASGMSAPTLGKITVGNGSYTNVSPDELNAMLANKDFLLVNVHSPYAGEIANTDLFIPSTEIENNRDKLPKDKGAKFVLYCRTGTMSTPTVEKLVQWGYTNVYNLAGGMNAWTAKQYPLLNLPK